MKVLGPAQKLQIWNNQPQLLFLLYSLQIVVKRVVLATFWQPVNQNHKMSNGIQILNYKVTKPLMRTMLGFEFRDHGLASPANNHSVIGLFSVLIEIPVEEIHQTSPSCFFFSIARSASMLPNEARFIAMGFFPC